MALFRQFFFRGLLPIPADIIAGVYYPWLDYKWGFPTGVPVKNPLISDIPSLLYPWRSFAIDQFKSLHWPLWNPYYFTGMPLLANFQSAVFSYVNLFFLFFPKALAWSFGVITSPFLTMLAMFVFLRHKKLNSLSSLLGSIVFSLSGFEIAWMEYNVHGHTALFLPLLLLAIDKIFEQKSKLWIFVFPILLAFQIFAGYIPIVIYSYLVCFIYILFFYFWPSFRKRKVELKKIFLLLGLWVWGIFLSAIQLFPGFELTKNSIRAIDPIVAASNASYLPLKNLATLLAPDFFGNPATGNYFGRAFYDNFYFFVGTGTLILIIFSLFFMKKEKSIFFWWSILLFSLIFVFKNPLGVFLEKRLLLYGGVSARALFITDFALGILAALGMEEYLKSKNKLIIFSAVVIIFVFFIAAVLFSFQIENPANRLVAQRNLVIPFAFLIVSAGVLLLGRLIKFIPVTFSSFLFVLLTSFQLLYSAQKYLPFSRKELLFPKTPVIDFLLQKQQESKEPFRVELGEVIPQNFLMPYGISTTSGYDALLPKNIGEFLTILETGKVQEKISRVQLIRNYNSPLFPLVNTKYLLAKKMDEKGIYSPLGKPPDVFLNRRFSLAFEDKTVLVYEDKNFLSRTFWFHLSQENEKDKLTQFVFPNSYQNDKIDWLVNEPNKIVLATESTQSGFIILSNDNYPGWEASVNANPVKIYQVNHSFQGIKMPAERNLLTIEYKPKSFLYGKIFSFLALVSWIVFFLFLRKNGNEKSY